MYTRIDPQSWKGDMPAFREKTAQFYAGEISKNEYKGFSGRYGSYAQKSGTASMLRLRMTAGRVTKEKLAFVAASIEKYGVKMAHFTTCESIQFHNLTGEQAGDIMEEALDVGIVTMGGGGDFPRNVMGSPMTGLEEGEYFDVLPYAEEAGEYLMNFVNAPKMPRKLKVCFSNSPKNIPHATYRDLGFVATPDGKFDVYSAGGLGNNPKFGVKVAEAIDPNKILYYIKAMWLTFCAHGNYENRGKARTRYMQDICGGPEGYRKAYQEKLAEVLASGEDLDLDVKPVAVTKTGDGTTISGDRIVAQKQSGLYTVKWHPIGGQPKMESLVALSKTIADMDQVEMRLSSDETAYIVNLTGAEAQKVLDATPDSAQTIFETTVSCIGASICQVGVRDSQALLAACVAAVKEADLPDGALPQVHISGCPSSCGCHQTGSIGFRGGVKKTADGSREAFVLYVGGNPLQEEEKMGDELGAIAIDDIPAFLVKVGKTVAASGMDYKAWKKANPEGVAEIAKEYL